MTLIKTKINLISLFDDEDEDVENENSNLKTIPNEIQEKLKNQNEFILFEHCLTIDNNKNNNNLTNDQNTNNNLYSTFTWRPCSSILSRFLLENENLISNKTVLELGCGTGLCGLICAKLCNAEKLILTDATIDYSHVKASVEHHEIDSKCEWFSWQWATFSKQILEYFKTTKIDLIIGSDCFYDNEEVYDDLLATINFLLNMNLNSKTFFITSYQERTCKTNISLQLKRFNLIGELLESRIFEKSIVHILKISLEK